MRADGRPNPIAVPELSAATAVRIVQLVAFGAVILAACWGAIEVPSKLGRVAPIWPANAITLSMLLMSPRARWPAWLAAAGLGNLAAALIVGDSLLLAAALALCNLVEVGLCAMFVRRFIGRELDLARVGDQMRFALIAGLLAPLVSAALVVLVAGRFVGDHGLSSMATWAAADGLGALIAVPVILTFKDLRRHLADATPAGWLSLAILAMVSALVFSIPQPLVFLIPPALLLVVFQLELLGAALGVVTVVAFAVASAMAGQGPMGAIHMGVGDRAMVSQVFLATITLTSFPIAAVLAQKRRWQSELLAAREAAEAAAAVKGEFLANMSHELRTPLTSVLGFTRLALEQPDLSPVSRGYIAKASNAGAALLATVNDVLDFSKLETGQLEIRREPSNPTQICIETLEMFSESAEAKGVDLLFEAQGLPAGLEIDPNRLRQLLFNLIGNAVKFSEGGEVALAAAWSPASGRLSISVKDHGPGIAQVQQSLLFRRFSQVDGSSTRRHGGTGLGLAICMGLVEAMDGVIGVESELGRGARFFFDIPAPGCASAEAQARSEKPVLAPGVRVLVADDHAVNRELVRVVLSPLGAEVTEAANGMEAVVRAGEAAFDVILMDMRMPELDGMAAMTAIRVGDGPNRHTPILAFSAGVDGPGAEGRRLAGFDGDLAKPLMPADLIAAVCLHAAGRPPVQADESHAA